MASQKNFSQPLIETEIDIEDNKPCQQTAANLDASDSSDIEVIAVCKNTNFKKRNKFLRPILNRKRTKVFVNPDNNFIKNNQESYIKEEIIISDESDRSDDDSKHKPMNINSNRLMSTQEKKLNQNKSLSTIILNCPRCNKTEKVFSITIKSTCKECMVNMSYVCNNCNNRYDTMPALYRHKKLQCESVSSKKKTGKKRRPMTMFLMKCTKCDQAHKLLQAKFPTACPTCGLGMRYECIVCSRSFNSYSGIYAHSRRHCQPKLRTYYCDHCSYGNTKQDTLLRHLAREHPEHYGEPKVSCIKCRRSFDIIEQLKQHEPTCGVPYYPCTYCSYKPKLMDNLMKHLLARHEDQVDTKGMDSILAQIANARTEIQEKVIIVANNDGKIKEFDLSALRRQHCSNCKQSFDFNFKKNKCETCGTAYCFECVKCSKTFGLLPSLHRHLRRYHTGAKYNCSRCGRSFSRRGDVNEHGKVCGREPSHQCELCPFKTRYKSSLRTHVFKLHNDNRPAFVCNICNVRYKTNRAMKRHVKMGCEQAAGAASPSNVSENQDNLHKF